MTRRHKDLVVEVRRDLDGKVYSRVLDRAVDPKGRHDPTRVDEIPRYVVIDRANGRQHDVESVQNRATYLSELLGVEYVEDLTWPCKAEMGYKDCHCPRCIDNANKRAKR